MEHKITFKQQYKMGLDLLKGDIENCKNDVVYSAIVPYFEYPISIMEQEVRDVACKNNDSEEYYEQKCEQIEDLYSNFTKTVAFVSIRFTSLSTKIRRRCQKIRYYLKKE